jgi:mono/diheme cytochrome c family protein
MTRAAWLCAVAAGMLGAACGAGPEERARELAPDMVRGPAYQAFQPNPVTRDGVTMRPPVPGTIARGEVPFRYGAGEAEAIRAGAELEDPIPPTESNLAEGKALFEIYCAVCHGANGRGDGPIAGKIPPPPSYASERVARFPPGRIFHVVTLGTGKMPPYAAPLSPEERWKVVTYVHAVLQPRPAAEAPP